MLAETQSGATRFWALREFDFGRDILKVIAIITMTLDHIGIILYPNSSILRIVGRLSFPIFAYLIVLGIESTKKPRNYLITLLVFALFSQGPYLLAFGIQPFRLNILFALFLSALAVYFYNKGNLLAIIPILLSIFLPTEGSYYVTLTAVGMRILKRNTGPGILVLLALNIPELLTQDIQVLSFFAVPLIILHIKGWLKMQILIPENSIYYSLRKYSFYVYYPLHLAILYSLNMLHV